jgi:two-component system, OmpR family, sensor histidine kinase TctE
LSEDKDDLVFYTLSGLKREYRFGYPDLPLPGLALSEKPQYYLSSYAGHPVRMMAARIAESDVPDGFVDVMIAKTLVSHDRKRAEWVWRILPGQLAMLLLTGFLLWWGVKRGLKPLSRLSDDIGRRSSLDFSPLHEAGVVAEVQPLVASFNGLMARVEQSVELQRRFVSDAAHQLRTPITGLKTQTELALRLSDPDEVRHSLQQSLKAADHAAHLVNQLLLLARAEPGTQQRVGFAEVDLAALDKATTETWVQTALNRNIDLGFAADGNACSLAGNPLLLGEMLNNLIDNALRYTQRGGRVTVHVTCDAGACMLEVEDDGPGIPEAEREKVFERFYRGTDVSEEGCGLGLAIVREIAEGHAAQVSLLSGADGSGTRVRVIFIHPFDTHTTL